MKKPKVVSFDINLALKDPFFDSIIGKTLKWALSVGRYLVIFTELVVIVSFATRFVLDRQVTDLNSSIEQKRNVVLSYGDLEANFRLAQARIENYSQVERQTNLADSFPSLSRIIPDDVVLDELMISQERVLISGSALSQDALNTLINNVQLSTDYHSVILEKIETQAKNIPGYIFSLRANTKSNISTTKSTIKENQETVEN